MKRVVNFMETLVDDTRAHVLLVDDRIENLIALEALLASNDIKITTSNSGEGALKHLISEEFALILLDVQMPGIDGYETAKLIKSRNKSKEIPIIFITAINQDPEHVLAGYAVGAIDYIFKPFDPDLLKSKVDGFIEMHNSSKQLKLKTELLNKKTKQLEEANDKLKYMATHDALTGLPNRIELYDKMDSLIKCSPDSVFSLVIFDLDNFKAINDTLGHSYGDELLKAIGSEIEKSFREDQMIVRLGGDEFAVILPNHDLAKTVFRVEELQHIFNLPFVIEGISLAVGASWGIVVFPEHGLNRDDLMRRADVAMYEAKRSGIGYAVYDKKHDLNDPLRLELMGDLRYAIDRGELVLHYQPKLEILTKKITGVEALVRWQHPKHGMIPPISFISIAEQIGIINPLTNWVLEESIKQCKEWEMQGIELKIAVNLSVRSLQDINFTKSVAKLLETYQLNPKKLQLEITESFLMSDATRAIDVLIEIRKLGIELDIDDFGTGYSSFSYMSQLPVNRIKIDKSFVMSMGGQQGDAMIVRSLINLAHNLNLEVIAEGVENVQIWETLSSWGCDEAQGFYIARPTNASDFMTWFKSQT
jgi:diguanylate cyclase (GGDEF)-like protein